MKHSAFVFGLASLVTACAAAPRHPLCNGDGSPACGNIGQVGRSQPANLRAMHGVVDASATPANPRAMHRVVGAATPANPRAMHAVVGASAEVVRSQPMNLHAVLDASAEVVRELARPDPELSFVVTRPALRTPKPRVTSRRHRRVTTQHRPLLAAFATNELAIQTQQQPRLTADDDVAVGNVMSKGGGGKHHGASQVLLTAAAAQPALDVQRPRVTDDDDFAVGNVMDKTK